MSDIITGDRISDMQGKSIQHPVRGKKNIEEEKLKKACADFESLFIYQLIKSMRNTFPVGDPSMKSFGKDAYNMMFDQKIAEEFSNKGQGGIGLQKILFKQLSKALSKK